METLRMTVTQLILIILGTGAVGTLVGFFGAAILNCAKLADEAQRRHWLEDD